MNPEAIEKLRYPIGKFDWEAPRTKEVLNEAIVKIKNFPAQLNELVSPSINSCFITSISP
jgi:hypothetical protein